MYKTQIRPKRLFKVLLPLFLLLSLAILSRPSTYSTRTIADENHFYTHAKNITQGFYADATNPNILDGPGYPILLSVPIALDIPFFYMRLVNILFLSLAAVYLLLILRRYVPDRPALVLTYLFGLYPPLLRWANLMYAESLMMLLLIGFCYHFIAWYHKEGKYKRHFVIALFLLGYLALTKIIFAYVILAALSLCLTTLFWKRTYKAYRLKGLTFILLGAMAVLSPYVIHNYQLTGKFFYLGTHGGITLYSRATPFENEWGNWFSGRHVLNGDTPTGRGEVVANMDVLKKNHEALFSSIDSLTWIEKDSILKAKAIENMKKHPKKYLKNTIANVSRIFFHFPFSYRLQNLDTLGYLIPNIFIVVLALLGIYPAVTRFRTIPKELVVLMAISLIYLGGHTLLDGRGRYLIPVVPIWLCFYAFVYFRILSIKINKPKEIGSP
ncbi:glycosyltransferase family protein [Pseudozobellia thermophila]|uniref:Dolichyl-phosphate-mannose-protein mannosyltransferase n=1 Tax=Pseudozobellia thermophila TaxID=192903 RepID=A0A1M6KQ05_9FLAO|nr:glycosyltransferase family 39 protein [Pseudozobellia thermophila]SHJ60976.1 Dolichyl-phosphate-mannose-protein mannosyltransferase [Pseudozobellia thermophila]